jgi:hypothetical protein
MMAQATHMIAITASTMKDDFSPMVRFHNPLKSASPVNSHASPTIEKQCPLSPPSTEQITIAGIHPVPGAIPDDNVKIPAPATLFTKLKTDETVDALPSEGAAAAFLFFFVVVLDRPPPRIRKAVAEIVVGLWNVFSDGRWNLTTSLVFHGGSTE